MLRISINDRGGERRLVLEGTLVAPWTDELERVWQEAREQGDKRKLMIDLSDVTRISAEGEETLGRLLEGGAKVACGGIFNRHVMKQLARRFRCK